MGNVTKLPQDTDGLAQWIAQEHMFISSSIRKVYYLPANAPEREIRLLEVTTRIPPKDSLEPIEAIDYKPDMDGVEFSLLVAAISEQEWDAIREGRPLLPEGWSLKNCKCIGRASSV